MSEPTESEVLARARRNFAERGHGDRAWDAGETGQAPVCGGPLLVLSQAERDEYIDQARHELRSMPAG